MSTPLYLALAAVLFLWVFFYLYVLVMAFYRLHLGGKLHGVLRVAAYPTVVIGYLVDLLANWTFAALAFQELPCHPLELVTDRLQRYMGEPGTRNHRWATWLCTNLLDPLDPTGAHCD